MSKALFFFREKKLDSFKKQTELSFKYATYKKDFQELHFYLATYYKYKHISDSAYYHYNISKELLLELGDTINAALRIKNIAQIQHKENDYLGSEINVILALKYLEKSNFFLKKHELYNLLGIIYSDRKEPLEAIKYYDLSLSFLPKDTTQFVYERLQIINNKGIAFQRNKQYQKSIPFFKNALSKNNIKHKYPDIYAMLIENIAFSNFSLKKYQNVLEKFKEALNINTQLKDAHKQSINHINISNYYIIFKKNKKAKEHAKKAFDLTEKTHFNKQNLEALALLSELSSGNESINYFREYLTRNGKALQKERVNKNQFAKIRYETDKKEKENTLLKTENEKKQAEITYQKQQKTIGWLVAASIMMLFGLSISFLNFRRKKLVYEYQLQKAEAREHERQQIAKSLHDEVAGDLRMLHQKLENSNLYDEAQKLHTVKENVRNLSHQLSSVSFDKVSFKDQIINLISDYFDINFKIKVNGLQDYDWNTINNSIKRLLFLSIRESIQNSQKHAEATQIIIDFSVHKKTVFLNITDNGKGFDTNISKKGIGLHNLQERVEELNGMLTIESEIGKGTKTYIQIPLNV